MLHSNPPIKLIIDADTANEIDDLFAIAYALQSSKFEVLGLCSVHFRIHDEAPANSVRASQALNEDLVRLCHRMDVPTLLGSSHWMGKAWGGDEPADSEAARFIIQSARELSEGERVVVAGQGAMTNIASALKLAPDIAARVDVYCMGFFYDPKTGVWNKNEFNIRNDLNAADYLLNHEDLSLHIMPGTTCRALCFDREVSFKALDDDQPLRRFLKDRWKKCDPDGQERIMWDLALILALAHPEMATIRHVATPPENSRKSVGVFVGIDAQAMSLEFWRQISA